MANVYAVAFWLVTKTNHWWRHQCSRQLSLMRASFGQLPSKVMPENDCGSQSLTESDGIDSDEANLANFVALGRG